ncbi:u1 small nuclear ribonucleoprotein a [Anaeramoeba flamelloides]|uniref:U1 small nuclear ribonucleoprotein a n=1 Tax=Anaeramoeba flamelloides TaxID=1746091 RepID=A0AAV7YHC3_9EUKA|nr:u1 small nuclear ribonucleoprotein a [Anaeramoeba flamelloides]
MTDLYAPNHTLYVRNIDESIKLNDLKEEFTKLFSKHGKVLDIHARKAMKMRGQCFVVFETLDSAIQAKQELNSFVFHEKPLDVQFAREKSDLVLKKFDKYDPEVVKKRRRIRENKRQGISVTIPKTTTMDISQQVNESLGTTNVPQQTQQIQQPEIEIQPQTTQNIQEKKKESLPTKPNRFLFVENLPKEAQKVMLDLIFGQFEGFKEVRTVPNNHSIAFVEYDNESNSTTAMNLLQGFDIKNEKIKITYLKV